MIELSENTKTYIGIFILVLAMVTMVGLLVYDIKSDIPVGNCLTETATNYCKINGEEFSSRQHAYFHCDGTFTRENGYNAPIYYFTEAEMSTCKALKKW